MKKILIGLTAAAVIGGVISLGGNRDSDTDKVVASASTTTSASASPSTKTVEAEPVTTPEATTTTTTPVPVPASNWKDDVFLKVLHTGGIYIPGGDQSAVNMAHAICEAFTAGVNYWTAISQVMSGGFSAYEAGYIVGASTGTYCPEHADKTG